MADDTPSPARGPARSVRVTLNGAPVVLAAPATVADVVAHLGVGEQGVAVALGREVVPRSAWGIVEVPDGALVEVVTAAPGG